VRGSLQTSRYLIPGFLPHLFGGIMLWEVYRYFTHGWITRYYVEPVVNFTYYGFSWVKPWPGRGMYIHFLCSVWQLLV
jgi:hypothetical protein